MKFRGPGPPCFSRPGNGPFQSWNGLSEPAQIHIFIECCSQVYVYSCNRQQGYAPLTGEVKSIQLWYIWYGISEWSHIWRLKLNPSKCHTISFTLRKSPVVHNYSLNGTALERRNETRDLGVILDAKLTFASHVDSTVSKANRMLGLLIRSMQLPRLRRSSRLDHRALICAYNAHVRSLLEYGSVVWSGTADTHLKRLERVQHRFLTWLAFRSDRPSADLGYEALLAHFNMCSVKARFIQHDVMFLYNVHHGRIDCPDLVSMFGLSVPSRLTRNPSLWAIPFARVNTVLRSLLCRVPAHTNSFLGSGSSADLFTSTHHSFLTGVRTFASRGGTYM